MQLTAKFVVLASALATSVLALPVDTNYDARDFETEVEARDVQEEVTVAARSFPSLSLDSRSFFDAEDDLEAREVTAVCS